MAIDFTDTSKITAGDIANQALREARAVGLGQTATAQQITEALLRLQFMLQQWERKRWLVYHLVTYSKVSTGALVYTFGPGGDIDTGAGSVRPARLETAVLRQLVQSQPNQIDYTMEVLQSMEDYQNIALKSLQSFPMYAFLDTAWPLANLYYWPVAQANIYELRPVVREQLPQSFTKNQATTFNIPFEYYSAMLYNLAIRLQSIYGRTLQPGDPLIGLAKDSLNTMRTTNLQVARLQMPKDMQRPGIYNIFSDRTY